MLRRLPLRDVLARTAHKNAMLKSTHVHLHLTTSGESITSLIHRFQRHTIPATSSSSLFHTLNQHVRNEDKKDNDGNETDTSKKRKSFHDIDVDEELQAEHNRRREERRKKRQEERKAKGEEGPEEEEEEEEEELDEEGQSKRKKRSGAKIAGQFLLAGAIVGLLLFGSSELYKNFIKPEHKDLSTMETLEKMFSFGMKEPIVKRLLPPLDEGIPPQRIRPVLVINVDDLLVHLDYNPEDGWKCQKRPGVDDFLDAVSKYYEVVLFSDSSMYKMGPVSGRLDSENRHHKLFKEHTALIDGHNVKNLDLLDRPIEKVLILDHNAGAYHLHPRNAINIQPWISDTRDTTLKRAAPFLMLVANYVKSTQLDIRDVIDLYKDAEKRDKEGEVYVETLDAILDKYEKALEEERQRVELLKQEQEQKHGKPSDKTGKPWYKIW